MPAELKDYKIEYEDGTEQYYQLDADDLELFKGLANDKGSPVKTVTAGTPDPINTGKAKAS